MNTTNNILTLTELIDLFEAGEIKEEGHVYKVYMTPGHKESNLVGFIWDSEFKGYLQLRHKFREHEKKIMWGDKT